MLKRVCLMLLIALPAVDALADCDRNDTDWVVGVPDLENCVVSWGVTSGPATLLVVPDGSGAAFTQARLADGTMVDATITLLLQDFCFPIANCSRSDIWLESASRGLVVCSGGTIADADTDANGITRWTLPLRAGGHTAGPIHVVVGGAPLYGLPLALRLNSPDLNGDGQVSLAAGVGAACP